MGWIEWRALYPLVQLAFSLEPSDFNKTFLAKQACRLLNNSESTIGRVLSLMLWFCIIHPLHGEALRQEKAFYNKGLFGGLEMANGFEFGMFKFLRQLADKLDDQKLPDFPT